MYFIRLAKIFAVPHEHKMQSIGNQLYPRYACRQKGARTSYISLTVKIVTQQLDLHLVRKGVLIVVAREFRLLQKLQVTLTARMLNYFVLNNFAT